MRNREVLELGVLGHVDVVDGSDYFVDVGRQGHFDHRSVGVFSRAALETCA